MAETININRPRRWDTPFDEDMSQEDVAHVLSLSPFSEMDQDKFPGNLPLDGIIQNDMRIRQFEQGDLSLEPEITVIHHS